MDIEKVAQIQDALSQLRELEENTETASAAERRAVRVVLRQLDKQVGKLQTAVLEEYPADYVACRDIGHSWRIKRQVVEDDQLHRVLKCHRCPTERTEIVNRYGDVLKRTYQHAEGYLIPSPLSGYRYTKQFWRGLQYALANRSQ